MRTDSYFPGGDMPDLVLLPILIGTLLPFGAILVLLHRTFYKPMPIQYAQVIKKEVVSPKEAAERHIEAGRYVTIRADDTIRVIRVGPLFYESVALSNFIPTDVTGGIVLDGLCPSRMVCY
jgi:hypothetical protein